MEERRRRLEEKYASKHAGGIEVLGRRASKQLAQHKSEGESVRFCIQGVNGQAIVALEERLLVIKPGWEAGAAFGGRVTSFYYSDITGVEVNAGLLMGVIEINTPSYQGTGEKDYWSSGNKDRDPHRVTNCLPTNKQMLKAQKPYLDELRVLIRAAKSGQPRGGASQGSVNAESRPGIVDELEKLANLKDRGILTEDEFAAQKQRILNPPLP